MSTEPADHRAMTPIVRTLRIITGAMLAGAVLLCVVALVVRHGGLLERDEPVPGHFVLTYVAVAYVAGALLARFLVPGLIVSSARRKIAQSTWRPPAGGASSDPVSAESLAQTGTAGMLCAVFLQRTIIAAAMVEGAVLLALVAYLLEGQVLALVAAGLAFLALAQLIPTTTGARNWLAEQLRRLEFE